jgi:hypothetical protein
VTDLTDSLPWWTRQDAGPTGTPAATPQGGGVGGQPPPGVDQQTWLNYLMQMFSPGSAQAGQPDINAQLNAGGSPVPSALSGGGPPVPPSVNAAPPPAPAPGGSILPQARGAAVPPGPMAAGSSVLPQGAAQASTPMGPPIPPGGVPSPVPGPLAPGGAGGVGATSNPRFIGIPAPNMSPQNSMRGGPQGTALNLAGLFGGGGVNPNVPAANAQPVASVPGPMASAPMPPVRPGVAPSDYGPLQRNRRWSYPSGMLPT